MKRVWLYWKNGIGKTNFPPLCHSHKQLCHHFLRLVLLLSLLVLCCRRCLPNFFLSFFPAHSSFLFLLLANAEPQIKRTKDKCVPRKKAITHTNESSWNDWLWVANLYVQSMFMFFCFNAVPSLTTVSVDDVVGGNSFSHPFPWHSIFILILFSAKIMLLDCVGRRRRWKPEIGKRETRWMKNIKK